MPRPTLIAAEYLRLRADLDQHSDCLQFKRNDTANMMIKADSLARLIKMENATAIIDVYPNSRNSPAEGLILRVPLEMVEDLFSSDNFNPGATIHYAEPVDAVAVRAA